MSVLAYRRTLRLSISCSDPVADAVMPTIATARSYLQRVFAMLADTKPVALNDVTP